MSLFFDAVEAHIRWKVRLSDYIEGKNSEALDPQVIACDDRCELGKWIYANQERYQHMAAFHTVRSEHAEFHKTAAGIVELCHAGEHQMANENLSGHYASISRKVITGIARLAQEVEGLEPTAASLN